MKHPDKSLNRSPYEAEESCERREAFVHRLKQVVEECRHSDIARHHDEVGGEPNRNNDWCTRMLFAVAAIPPPTKEDIPSAREVSK